MKRFIALVLSLVMALSLCVPAWGADPVTYEVADKTAFTNALNTASDGDTIKLTADVNLGAIAGKNYSVLIDKAITLDGGGHTLTSTAGRAINVDCGGNVTIKNLIIVASGERAINVVQKPATLMIDKVTATAENYTVNVANSAGAAKVTITNGSTLNGLCTVNVSGPGAVVTIDSSTVNCNDNNTAAGEGYAALSLNYDADGGKIIATNTIVNVTENSDSFKGRNAAEGGVVTINGSADGVHTMVAAIFYGTPYYHTFASLKDAAEFAEEENADTITLINNTALTEDVALPCMLELSDGVTLNGGNRTISVSGETWSTSNESKHLVKLGNDSVVENVVLDSEGKAAGVNAYVVTGAELNNVTIQGSVGAALTVNGSEVEAVNLKTSGNTWGSVNVGPGVGVASESNFAISGNDTNLDGGKYGAIWVSTPETDATVDVTISGGTYGVGSVVTGSINADPAATGVSIFIIGGTFAAKPDDSFVANGYEATEKDGKWVVAEEVVEEDPDIPDTPVEDDKTEGEEVAVTTPAEVDTVVNNTVIEAVKDSAETTVTVTTPVEGDADAETTIKFVSTDTKQDFASATDITTALTAVEEIVTDEVTAKVEEKVSDDAELAAYLDIDITVFADGDPVGEITQLPKEIKVVIPASALDFGDLEKNHTRKVSVIRFHDDQVDVIPAKLEADGSVSFYSHLFSTYAVVYEDVPTYYGWGGYYPVVGSTSSSTTDKTVTSAKTFDAGIGLYIGMSIAAAAGSAVIMGKKRED